MTIRNNNTTRTAITEAAGALEDARAKLARVEADRGAAQAELESLQGRAGDEVLDAPDTAAALSRTMQELRDRIDLLGRAAEAQKPRVRAAEVAYLETEADQLDKVAAAARKKLAAHQGRTEELLKQLKEHEGPFVPEHLLIDEQSRNSPGGVSWEMPKSAPLEDAVTEAETPVLVLREMAAGRDPAAMLRERAGIDGRIGTKLPHECYPACVWGPDALVTAPGYHRRVEERQGLETSLATAERRVAEIQAAIDRGNTELVGFQDWHGGMPKTLGEQLENAKQQRDQVASRLGAVNAVV